MGSEEVSCMLNSQQGNVLDAPFQLLFETTAGIWTKSVEAAGLRKVEGDTVCECELNNSVKLFAGGWREGRRR